MTDKYSISVKTPRGASVEYGKRQLEAARREIGYKLFDILWRGKLPAVVDVEENIIQHPDFDTEQETQITVTINPVQHRHIVFSHGGLSDYRPIIGWTTRLKYWLRKFKL